MKPCKREDRQRSEARRRSDSYGSIAAKGIISLLPIVLALFLAFLTKDAVFSLVIGCIADVVVAGFDPATGFSKLFQHALGNGDFIWVLMIEVAIGIMIAFYLKAGVISAFADWASTKSAHGGRPRDSAGSGVSLFSSAIIFLPVQRSNRPSPDRQVQGLP